MSAAVTAGARLRRACVRGLAGIATLVALAAGAAATPPGAPFLSVAEYRDMYRMAVAGHFGAQQTLTLFATGLLNAAAAFDDFATQADAKPSTCLSVDVQPVALLQAIDAELEANAGFWQGKDDNDIGFAALAAMKRRWPCR